MCKTNEIENDTPKIYWKNSIRPCQDAGVPSSLTLDGEDAITVAPNAQGKSTFLRAGLLSSACPAVGCRPSKEDGIHPIHEQIPT